MTLVLGVAMVIIALLGPILKIIEPTRRQPVRSPVLERQAS